MTSTEKEFKIRFDNNQLAFLSAGIICEFRYLDANGMRSKIIIYYEPEKPSEEK